MKLERLVTHEIPLEEAVKAMELVAGGASGTERVVKVQIIDQMRHDV